MEPTEQEGTTAANAPGGLLRRHGLRLAMAVPAALAALHVGVASAAKDKPDKPKHQDDPSPSNVKAPHKSSVKFPLSRVSAPSSADFTGGGSDALDHGQVLVHSAKDDGTQVSVRINGSDQHNADYQLQFRRFNDHQSENIGGTFKTNDHGAFHGHVGTLSGNHRVGVFVVQRGGTDQYVTSVNL